MILKGLYGYRVRWREGTTLRQETCHSYEAARRLNARKVLKKRGGQQRRRPEQPRNITVNDFAEHWLDRQRFRVAPKTHASYAETVKRYIVKEGIGIGALRVRDVERGDIETILGQAVTKSRSGALSRNTLRIIRATCSLILTRPRLVPILSWMRTRAAASSSAHSRSRYRGSEVSVR